jgi:hypothetical protein
MIKSLRACTYILLIAAVSSLSPAEARPDARALSCAEVQALLLRQRAATLTTGPNTYSRYVGPGVCDGTGLARPTSVATKDTGHCTVHVCGPRVPRTK